MVVANEGAYVWIRKGIHEAVAFSSSICYYINYVVDTALYPALFVSYFVELNESLFSSTLAFWLITVCLILCVTALNLAGVEIQGYLSSFLTLFVLSPIPVLFVWGAVAGWMTPSVWLAPPPALNGSWTHWANMTASGGATQVADDVNTALNIVLWSNTGYDAVGSLVEQLQDSERLLGRSMAGAVLLSTTSYLLILLGLLGAPPRGDYREWQAGYFGHLANLLGGTGLRVYVVLAALVGTFGTIQALMLPISNQLYELCGTERLNIPLFRHVMPRSGVPWVAVLFNAGVTISLSRLGFELLVQVNNIFYSVNLLLICVAYVRLCPRSLPTRLAVAAFPVVICAWLAVSMFWLVSWIAGLVCLACYVFFGGVWWLCKKRRSRNARYTAVANVDDLDPDDDDENNVPISADEFYGAHDDDQDDGDGANVTF